MADPLRLVDTYSLYIDGQWVEPRSGRYDDISPSTEADDRARLPMPTSTTSTPRSAPRARRSTTGPWSAATSEERARCLGQLGNALLEHADDFFALVAARVGVHRQRAADPDRRSRLHGPARGRARRAVGRRTDRRVRGGRHHAAPPRASRRRVRPDAVELPAQPQRHEGGQRTRRRQHRRAQAVAADPARRPCPRPDHRRAHRHPAGRGQRRHPERRRCQQGCSPPIRGSTW